MALAGHGLRRQPGRGPPRRASPPPSRPPSPRRGHPSRCTVTRRGFAVRLVTAAGEDRASGWHERRADLCTARLLEALAVLRPVEAPRLDRPRSARRATAAWSSRSWARCSSATHRSCDACSPSTAARSRWPSTSMPGSAPGSGPPRPPGCWPSRAGGSPAWAPATGSRPAGRSSAPGHARPGARARGVRRRWAREQPEPQQPRGRSRPVDHRRPDHLDLHPVVARLHRRPVAVPVPLLGLALLVAGIGAVGRWSHLGAFSVLLLQRLLDETMALALGRRPAPRCRSARPGTRCSSRRPRGHARARSSTLPVPTATRPPSRSRCSSSAAACCAWSWSTSGAGGGCWPACAPGRLQRAGQPAGHRPDLVGLRALRARLRRHALPAGERAGRALGPQPGRGRPRPARGHLGPGRAHRHGAAPARARGRRGGDRPGGGGAAGGADPRRAALRRRPRQGGDTQDQRRQPDDRPGARPQPARRHPAAGGAHRPGRPRVPADLGAQPLLPERVEPRRPGDPAREPPRRRHARPDRCQPVGAAPHPGLPGRGLRHVLLALAADSAPVSRVEAQGDWQQTSPRWTSWPATPTSTSPAPAGR